MAAPVAAEKVVYLLDPVGASRRSAALRAADSAGAHATHCDREHAFELPVLAAVSRKARRLGVVARPVHAVRGQRADGVGNGADLARHAGGGSAARRRGERVCGVRLLDQGVDREGRPDAGFMPGMDIHAALTVVGDGPVGAVGRQLDEHFGLPAGHHQREWAVGMKMVVDLPAECDLEPGTVIPHLRLSRAGDLRLLLRASRPRGHGGHFRALVVPQPHAHVYRYLQHYMLHPYLWRYLKGGRLRSWGAKSLQESGKRGEPFLAGDGYARIGEGSGSTNVLTGSGVDEAWTTGIATGRSGRRTAATQASRSPARTWSDVRGAAPRELGGRGRPRRRKGARRLPSRRDHRPARHGAGRLHQGQASRSRGEPQLLPDPKEYYRGKIPPAELERIMADCRNRGVACHDALMDRCGWPAIPYDGQLLVSHQDALLLGGKVQAPAGFADHVRFVYPDFCERCVAKLCIEMCSGQAITPGADGVPAFDREKCVHCGACLWNCGTSLEDDPQRGNIDFRAGAGGLHSAEN